MLMFWYDCVKPKCCEKAKLFYVDTDTFIVFIKTDDIYEERCLQKKMLKPDLRLQIIN